GNASVKILAGNNYVYLFNIRENKACDAFHNYLGEFVYAIERAMGLIPRACPIPKNKYHFYNLPIDANKITTAINFPFGNLRITIDILDRKDGFIDCVIMEVVHTI
ncbi:hypothetical protein ILUMI_13646, partial [Ignelater luminosus]